MLMNHNLRNYTVKHLLTPLFNIGLQIESYLTFRYLEKYMTLTLLAFSLCQQIRQDYPIFI